jgi:integrase
MPWIRQLDSGRWAATVYTPAGRITESHESKTVIKRWANNLASEVAMGDFIDPRDAEITVSEWWEQARPARIGEKASLRRDLSHWRNHVEPYWGKWRIGSILKPDCLVWIQKMKEENVGPATIHGAVHVLRTLLEAAIDDRRLRVNPCRNLRLPRIPKHIDRVLEWSEQDLIIARLDELFPDRPDAGLMVRTMVETGPRWEEVAAVRKSALDFRRRRICYGPVVEADGTIREYAKTEAGDNRWVGFSSDLAKRLKARADNVSRDGLMFPAPGGGVLRYSNWHRRVWTPSLTREGAITVLEKPAGMSGPKRRRVELIPLLEDPQPTPHDLRHTYGTRLAEEGVEEHRIAARMGHESARSTKRYIHASAEHFEAELDAMERSRQRERERNRRLTDDS